MYKKVKNFIEKYNLLNKEDKVVIGVSGGADSIYLLHILNKFLGSEKIIVSHINHGFREESKEEFEFVKSLCNIYGNKFEGIEIDVNSYIKKNKVSSQVASRECRYSFYNKILEKYGVEKLVLGHHGDDLVETLLMRQTNGSSNKGLIGIKMRRDFFDKEIIRPLLCLNKEEIYNEVENLNLEFREDKSNFTETYLRNRIRLNVLPKLKEENSKVHLKFLEQSINRSEDEEYFDNVVDQYIADNIICKEFIFELDKESFNNLFPSIKRRLLSTLISKFEIYSLDNNILDDLNEKIKKDSSSDYNELIKDVYIVNDYEKFHIIHRNGIGSSIDNLYVIGNGVFKGKEKLIEVNNFSDLKIRLIKDGDRIKLNGINRRVVSILGKEKIALAFRKEASVVEVNGVIKLLSYGEFLIRGDK